MDVFVGIDVLKDRLDICIRPSGETLAVTRDDEGLASLGERLRASSRPGRARGDGWLRDGSRERGRRGASAPGGDQSMSDPRLRPLDRQARQDRSPRRCGDRSLRRSHTAARPARRCRRSAGAGTAGGALSSGHRDDRGGKNRRRLAGHPRVSRPSIGMSISCRPSFPSSIGTLTARSERARPWQADAHVLPSVQGVGRATLRTLIAELPALGRLDRRKLQASLALPPSIARAARCEAERQSPAGAPRSEPPATRPR
jgi:transposase